ncbi:MAG: P-II family nitrogen regulator [Xanthomonadales bacterium]|nr:P-II family nitrogen regulator [Xanthomonadales bacterium]
MNFRKVTGIIRPDRLEAVENHLKELNVSGVSVSKVKGYGEYANFFQEDWFSTHTRIVIYTSLEQATTVAEAIMESAHTGTEGDGLVVISPIETIYHIRNKQQCIREVCA